MQSLGTPKWSPEKNTYNFVVFELWASEKKSVITTFSNPTQSPHKWTLRIFLDLWLKALSRLQVGQNRDFCQIWTVFCAVCHQLPFKNSHSYEKVYQTENVTSISRNSFGRNEFSVQTILMQFYGKKPRNLQKWSKITVFGMPHFCAWRYKKIYKTENVEFT